MNIEEAGTEQLAAEGGLLGAGELGELGGSFKVHD